MLCYKYLKILCVVCATTMVCAQNMTTPATNTSTVTTNLTTEATNASTTGAPITAETNASTSSNTEATNASTTGAPVTAETNTSTTTALTAEATNASTAAAPITETNVTTAASTTVTADRTTVTDETEGTTGMQNSTQLPTDGILLTCGKDFMSVTIPKRLLVEGVQEEDLTFDNSQSGECYGEISGDDVVLNTSLTDCGTERTENDTYEVYSNIVVNSETNETISRQYKVKIPVTCIYSRSGRVHQAWYRLTDYILDKDLEGTGKYSFDLKLYEDDNFEVPIEGYPYVSLNEELYFAATLGSEEYSDLDLSIKSCKATDAVDYDSVQHYDLITEWKVKDEKTNISCQQSGTNTDEIQVITHAFRFVKLEDDQDIVYIHCDLYVCETSEDESKCSEQCDGNSFSSRRRRDVGLDSPPLPIQRLTRGPIRFRRAAPVPDELPKIKIQEGGNTDLEMSTPITMWGLVAVVMGAVVIVLLAALVVTLRKLAVTSKTAATRKNDEESAPLLDDEDSD